MQVTNHPHSTLVCIMYSSHMVQMLFHFVILWHLFLVALCLLERWTVEECYIFLLLKLTLLIWFVMCGTGTPKWSFQHMCKRYFKITMGLILNKCGSPLNPFIVHRDPLGVYCDWFLSLAPLCHWHANHQYCVLLVCFSYLMWYICTIIWE